jgi:hypothetical protein
MSLIVGFDSAWNPNADWFSLRVKSGEESQIGLVFYIREQEYVSAGHQIRLFCSTEVVESIW